MTQTDEIHSGGSYLSQNDLRVHFGLGQAPPSIRLRFVGHPERLSFGNLSADHYYSVLEGEGVVSPNRIRPIPAKH